MSHTDWLESLLAERTRTFVDEFGSFYAWLEGSYGGDTLLLWMNKSVVEEVLPQLPKHFKGRMVLGLDISDNHSAPFARALYWANPRRALVVCSGEGLGHAYPGRKEVAEGEWMPWDDPREARQLEVVLRPEFSYHELRAYAPWEAPPPAPLPTFEGPRVGAVGWERGIPTYGLGLVGLGRSLEALLEAWRLR